MENRARIRIKRKYLKDEYSYSVYYTYKSKAVKVRQFGQSIEHDGTISDDLKSIEIPTGLQISGLHDEKPKTIFKLKVPKDYEYNIKENFV